MNAEAASLGSALNVAPPSFVEFHPATFLRRFDARTHGEEGGP
jgi:hypothetical protein